MKKRFLSVILCMSLGIGTLVGCGSSSAPADVENSTETANEIVNVKMCMIGGAGSNEDSDEILEKVNGILEPEVGARLEIEWIDVGEYVDQINLKLSSGENIDIIPVFSSAISALYSKDAMYPITDLVEEYGQGIVEAVGEDYIKAGYKDGELCMLPTVGNFAEEISLYYRKDIAEKYSIDMSQVETLEDLTPILETVHENEPNMYGLISNSPDDGMLYNFAWDGLGDEYGVLMNPTESIEISNLFETEEYENYVKLMHDWYEKGYIQQDAATSPDNIMTIMGTGKGFGVLYHATPEAELNESANCGYEIGAVTVQKALSRTDNVLQAILFVSSTSEHPDKAVQVLNELYSNGEIMSLLRFGVEGKHYQVLENGCYAYLEGEDMSSCTYHPLFSALFGNQTIAGTWNDYNPTYYDEVKEYNKEAGKSLALGFSYDTSSLTNELAALASVVSKYRRGLECGSLDPETELPKFQEELRIAGIEKVIEEKQNQLNAWYEENVSN